MSTRRNNSGYRGSHTKTLRRTFQRAATCKKGSRLLERPLPNSSSMYQSPSARRRTNPSPESVVASSSSPYLVMRNINCLDVSTGMMLSQWPIHNDNFPRCIAPERNWTLIAASNELSGTLLRTSKLGLSSSIQLTCSTWPSQHTTAL